MNYVICREKITSPAPSAGAEAIGLRANMECGAHCPITTPGPLMEVRCPYGHYFLATEAEIREDAVSNA